VGPNKPPTVLRFWELSFSMYSARFAGVTAESAPAVAVIVYPCDVKYAAFVRVIWPLK
jgi:hypothetical protein